MPQPQYPDETSVSRSREGQGFFQRAPRTGGQVCPEASVDATDARPKPCPDGPMRTSRRFGRKPVPSAWSAETDQATELSRLTHSAGWTAQSVHEDGSSIGDSLILPSLCERSDFLAAEKELMDIIGILRRAAVQLERDAAKNSGSSLLQTRSTGDFVQALASWSPAQPRRRRGSHIPLFLGACPSSCARAPPSESAGPDRAHRGE